MTPCTNLGHDLLLTLSTLANPTAPLASTFYDTSSSHPSTNPSFRFQTRHNAPPTPDLVARTDHRRAGTPAWWRSIPRRGPRWLGLRWKRHPEPHPAHLGWYRNSSGSGELERRWSLCRSVVYWAQLGRRWCPSGTGWLGQWWRISGRVGWIGRLVGG